MVAYFQFLQGGMRPLHLAASNGHVDVIEYLVKERKAHMEPKLTVNLNMTPLVMHAWQSRPQPSLSYFFFFLFLHLQFSCVLKRSGSLGARLHSAWYVAHDQLSVSYI